MRSCAGAIVRYCGTGRGIDRLPEFIVTQRSCSIVFSLIAIAAWVIAIVSDLE